MGTKAELAALCSAIAEHKEGEMVEMLSQILLLLGRAMTTTGLLYINALNMVHDQ